MTNFNSELEANAQSDFEEQFFTRIVEETNDHTIVGELSAQNITLWKNLFQSQTGNLHLDHMYDALGKTIVSVVCCYPRVLYFFYVPCLFVLVSWSSPDFMASPDQTDKLRFNWKTRNLLSGRYTFKASACITGPPLDIW